MLLNTTQRLVALNVRIIIIISSRKYSTLPKSHENVIQLAILKSWEDSSIIVPFRGFAKLKQIILNNLLCNYNSDSTLKKHRVPFFTIPSNTKMCFWSFCWGTQPTMAKEKMINSIDLERVIFQLKVSVKSYKPSIICFVFNVSEGFLAHWRAIDTYIERDVKWECMML